MAKDDLPAEENPFEPRRNDALLGHEEAEKTILDAWNSKRMHHAWLLCGPKGVGKATLAYRMARFILSGGGENGGAGLFGDQNDGLYVDPEDPVARRIAGGGHGDLKVVERQYDDKKTPAGRNHGRQCAYRWQLHVQNLCRRRVAYCHCRCCR